MSCKICKISVVEDKAAICDMCKCPVCFKCSKLNSTEQRAITLKGVRKLKYYCEVCENKCILLEKLNQDGEVDMKNILLEVLKMIKEQNNKIDEMETNLKALIMDPKEDTDKFAKQLPSCKQSYASMVKEPVIIIKPVEEQGSNITLNDIETHINPAELAIGINEMKSTKDGSVVISCADRKSVETMKNEVIQKLGQKYSVDMSELRNPRAIIIGVEEKVVNMEKLEVIKIITQQNEQLHEEANKIKVVKTYMVKKNSGNIVLEVEPNIMKKLIELGKIHVIFRNCKVYEYFNVLRCFNCGQFGHKKCDCKNYKVCFTCFNKHEGQCTSGNPICINCKNMNQKVNLKLDINHSIYDRDCPCYQRIINTISRKTKSYNL